MQKVLDYLKTNIDKNSSIKKWNANATLSIQLANSYQYYQVDALGEQFLLVEPLETQTVQKTKIQLDLIANKTEMQVAVLLKYATMYRTMKMLEERIPFIATDKQMYLPFMALHIRKQVEKEKKTLCIDKFTPATQLIYLAMLYMNLEEYGTDELAKKLKVSAMTVLRALDELEQIGLGHYEIGGKTGRKKIFKTIDKKAYYQIGKKYLINPIKKTIFIKELPTMCKLYKSGYTALGEQTMLGEPAQETYAVSAKMEKTLLDLQVSCEQAMEEALPQVQLMKYDISLLTENQYVDPITMILCLEEMDERVEMAIEELMEENEWYVE